MKHPLAWLSLAICALAATTWLAGGPGPRIAAEGARAENGTLMLTVALDSGGATVLQALRKPALEFRAGREAGDEPLRWTMLDAAGAVLGRGAFDPGRICLDPGHRGRPAHLEGDVAIPHATHVNLKVPDLAAFHSLRFEWGAGDDPRPIGEVLRAALEVR